MGVAQLLSGNQAAAAFANQLSPVAAAVASLGAAGLASSAAQTTLFSLDAAVDAAKGCAACALNLRWPRNEAFRVCTAAPLVLRAGRLALAALLAAVEQCQQHGEQIPADTAADLWNFASHQISAITCIVGQLASPIHQPALAAAVAATAAPPELLLPWLVTASQAFLAAYRVVRPGE